MGEDDLIYPAEAQRRLKWSKDRQGKKLKRVVDAKEQSSGQPIWIRSKGGRRQITMRILRSRCPELFVVESKMDLLRNDFKRYLSDIDTQMEDVARRVIASDVRPVFEELRTGQQVLQENLVFVAENINELAKRFAASARMRSGQERTRTDSAGP